MTIPLAILGAYTALCLLAYVFQAKLVYFPATWHPPSNPGKDVEQLRVTTSDGVEIVCWIVADEETDPRGGALIFCHGNAGHVGDRMSAARAFRDMGRTVFLFDYRGYGASDGSPTETGTYLDAEAIWELARERGFAPDRIALYGESLGCGIAVELARRREVERVVLESGFTSIPDMGAKAYPWLPVRLLARIRYDNVAKIGELDVPLLLIHSPFDEIVPFQHAERLQRAARDAPVLLRTGGGHNSGGFLQRSEWTRAVAAFVGG